MSDNAATRPTAPTGPVPPVAPKHPTVRRFHGNDFSDDYEWMRDKTSRETLDYLEAENAYTDSVTAPLEGLREAIVEEMKTRVKQTDMSVPVRMGGHWYYARTREGSSYPLSCRLAVTPGADAWTPPVISDDESPAGEQVLLDQNVLAEGEEFFQIGCMSVTTSGDYLAYSTDTTGDERFTMHFKDLRSGDLLADELTGLFYGGGWVGEDYFFYVKCDQAWRPYSVWRHRMGTPQERDVCVFTEADEKFWVDVSTTRSEKYIVIEVGSKLTGEAHILEADNPTGQFRCVMERTPGVDYSVDHAVVRGDDRLVVVHNANGVNYEVAEGPVDGFTSIEELSVLVPHDDTVRIEGVDCFRDHLTLGYRKDAIGRIATMNLDPETGYTEFSEIPFDEELYTAGSGGNPEWDAPVIRLGYTSWITPNQVWDYRPATGEKTLLKQQEVGGGYNPDDYIAERMWATATDGTRIPVSVIRRKDVTLDTPRPVILYGYGSYEASNDPGFSVMGLSALNRGVVSVQAHVRGGGEMGRAWYDAGKMLSKTNTFDDFIAVADFLIEQGITTPELLAAEGASAGGLLMGAVANRGGDRFTAIAAIVPFVDPLTSMLMPELPLTVTEWEEWGDPLHDTTVYDYMRSYSPYENVTAKHYPDILAVTNINDTRVLYVEPAKWIAKLRATATGGQFLLKVRMAGGHGGVSGRYDKWRESAFAAAWLINKVTGKTS
ncbi:S9 family peptidase [Corynebacterium mendelii]|uniref:S9 family peptidase n=1 Tax=Corynebacterium mendelii TaxID=2765362 RepID=A0A939E204_9CORY|nr:S9 family peptidase [Corynebacterium mendelii]MBN9645041.1 S9 family peptidase [Corynebacterium mendelii]